MTKTEIARFRLFSQQIAASKFSSTKDLVGWMGAMQAQDFSMSIWAIGTRLRHINYKKIESAINSAQIIRTHCLRPTWHLVAAEDIRWLLELTAPQILVLMKSRHAELNLSENEINISQSLLRDNLAGNRYKSRDELVAEFKKAGIATDNNRASHLFLRAELDGLICSGPVKKNNTTFALLDERVPFANKKADVLQKNPEKEKFSRQDALQKLARKYFTSHGPATLQDFVWWSGLGVGDARKALEMVQNELRSEGVNNVAGQTFWFSPEIAGIRSIVDEDLVYLLPAYDEFIISYKDRTAALGDESYKKTVSTNGIFRPVVIVNGQVAGIWKRTIKKDNIIIETEFFNKPGKFVLGMIEQEALRYGEFFDKKVKYINKE